MPPLRDIVFLTHDALIEGAYLEPGPIDMLVDTPWAMRLERKGLGYCVASLPHWVQGEITPEIVRFLNAVMNFPLHWRSPEWEELVTSLTLPDCVTASTWGPWVVAQMNSDPQP